VVLHSVFARTIFHYRKEWYLVMVSLLQRVVTMVLSDGKFASESVENGT
jgi:hypothetical protein